MRAVLAILSSKYQLKEIIARVRKSSFVKNVLVVISGSAVAQVVGFSLSPVISRLFSPSDFGVYGSFDSIATIIAAGVTLDYTQSIMLPKEDADAINLFFVSCISTFGVGLLCLTCCLIAPQAVNSIMKTSGFWALALLVMATVVSGLNQSCQAWCVRSKAFKHTSASQVIRSLSSNGTQIGLGYLRGGGTSLIIASVLANLLASLNLFRVVFRDFLKLRHHIRWDRMKQLAKEYHDFPVYSASMNVMIALSTGLPVLLLTHFYGIAVAGAYAFGVRILQTPMSFVLGALRQVLFQKACETRNRGDRLMPLYVKITSGLFALAIIPSVVLIIWAPQLFSLIFGFKWYMAGEFARSLVLWLIFMFCNLPSILFARIIRMQRQMFFFDVVLLAARALTLILGGMYMTASNTVMAFSLVGALMNIIFIFIIGHAIMRKEGNIDGKIIPI